MSPYSPLVLLVPLLRESLLPAESRALSALGIDKDLASHLGTLALGTEVCAVTIASAVELPSLVPGRVGTIAVIEADDAAESAGKKGAPAPVLRGVRRAKIATVDVAAKRFSVTLAAIEDMARLRESLVAASDILARLAAGAAPDNAEWETKISPALTSLARAVGDPRDQGTLVVGDLAEVLVRLRDRLGAAQPARDASDALEKIVGALPPTSAESPSLPEAERRRLWSQVVEIQRKLDLYDTDAHELGSDIARLAKRLSQAGLRGEAKALADRELKLLRGNDPSHGDYTTMFAHLDLLARLPWHPGHGKTVDLARVRASLDATHSGLDRVKTRILEYLAVKQLGGTAASTILCLGGPPGVGKTTIAKAIADALGRPFVRVPLGGVHDESEIRGHRRTFTAATAGRIVSGMTQSLTNDPVMLLDEIDKIGTERARSPTGALLEVLDPAQHTHFSDNFLGVPYDLSHVLFICTANDLENVHPVLLDRLEVVELEGYTSKEKIAIAEAHFATAMPREHGIAPLALDEELMAWLVERYTREAGVRELRRVLARLYRHEALAVAEGRRAAVRGAPLTMAEAEEILGPPRYREPPRAERLPAGVANGLATSRGRGSLLRIEVATVADAEQKKGELVLTGSLGAIMKESVRTVLGHLRTNAKAWGLSAAELERTIYVHVPDAATPKEGPSAGCALFAAIVSAFTGRLARADAAVTGELSLTGEVRPVGGIRDKVNAAERAGLRTVILPEENRADVPKETTIEVVYAARIEHVIAALLAKAPPPATDIGPDTSAERPPRTALAASRKAGGRRS